MIDTRLTRAVALFVLLAGLVGGFVWYGTLSPNPTEGRYPHMASDDHHPEEYIDTQIVVNGQVIQIDPLVVKADYTTVRKGEFEHGTAEFTVTNVSTTPTVGDHLQVYGVLETFQMIRAYNVVVVPARNIIVMYLLSFIAGLWTLGRLVRQWRLDWSRVAVVRRGTPLNFAEIVHWKRSQHTEDEADA